MQKIIFHYWKLKNTESAQLKQTTGNRQQAVPHYNHLIFKKYASNVLKVARKVRWFNSIQFFISIHTEQYNFLLFIKLSMSFVV